MENDSLDPRAPVPFGEKIGYGLGDTAANLVWRTLIFFLPIFYTDVFGLSAAAVGTLMLVCRMGDGVTDFFMGIIADRTRTRWGKFRPWILWTALPFGIMTVLTFSTPDLSYTGKLAYAYLTYGGLILVFTANNIPYSALTGVITADPVERTSLSSYRFVGAFLGGLITQGLNIYLVEYFGQGDQIKGYKWTMALFAVISIILFLITFATTKERVKSTSAVRSTIKTDAIDLMRNKPWVILFFVGSLFVAFTTFRGGVTMYYFKYYINNVGIAAIFMVIGLLSAMFGAAITSPLTRRFGKRAVMNACLILGIVSSASIYLIGPDGMGIVMIFVLSAIAEFSTGPIVVLFFAMLADAADYSEWMTHRRATGLIFSAGTLSMKVGTAVAAAASGWMLAWYGYAANVEQTAEALLGIRLLFSLIPALVGVVLLVVFQFYKLDESLLDRIEADLIQR
ncbi:MAG: glycoside-pentoside-hexuronide (GPH):cation symporter [Rhodothermia bacterium]